MATNGGPNIIEDGLVGQIDGGAINNYQFGTPDSRTGYLQAGPSGEEFYVETDVILPHASGSPYNFKFGSDRNTRIQISGADGNFASTTGPFNLPGYDWNHNLYFSGAHTGQNYIAGTGLSAYTIEMDRYYNVIMTHDNSDGAHKVYINGNLQQSSTQSDPTLSSGNIRRFYVGNWDASWSCVGCIPIIRVYSKVLSVEEVTQNFNATKVRFNL